MLQKCRILRPTRLPVGSNGLIARKPLTGPEGVPTIPTGREEYVKLSERPTVEWVRPEARERAPTEPIQEPTRVGRAVEGLDLSFFLPFPPRRWRLSPCPWSR